LFLCNIPSLDVTFPEIGMIGSTFPQISLIAWKRLDTIGWASLGTPPSAYIASSSISPILVVVHGLSSKVLRSLRAFWRSGRWAIPIKHMNPTLNTQCPPLIPSKKLALMVAILFSIYKSNQMSAVLGNRTSEASCLLICSGNASIERRGKSVLMCPKKLLRALPLTRITQLWLSFLSPGIECTKRPSLVLILSKSALRGYAFCIFGPGWNCTTWLKPVLTESIITDP